MTKESTLVFVQFGVALAAALFVLIVANSLADGATSTLETPWKTFNPTARDVHDGRLIMERNGCFACHSVDGFGGSVGPALNGVSARKTRKELFKWIQSPWSVKPGTRMPEYGLNDETVLKIVSYLETKDSLTVQR